MSRRPTKSFFDQDNSAKAKASFPRKKAGNQSSRNNVTNSTSLPASENAKSKLGAFTFAKPATTRRTQAYSKVKTDDDIQTTSSEFVAQDNGIPTPTKAIIDEIVQIPTPSRPGLRSPNELPLTPAPRLSISELLGNDEEKSPFRDSQSDDPTEARITWAKATPGSKKGMGSRSKRAASSSPPMVRTPASKRQQNKSAEEDPAAQLWKRYGSSGDSGSIQHPANPAARLFAPDRMDRSPSGLRRSTTMPEVPLSHNRLKRRKMTVLDHGHSTDASVSEDGGTAQGSRRERVFGLLNQVKMGIKMPPASSAPQISPEDSIFSSSPIRAIDQRRSEPLADEPPSSPIKATDHLRHLESTVRNTTISSISNIQDSDSDDYGDFNDNDMNMLLVERMEEFERVSSNMQQPQTQYELLPPSAASVPDASVLDEFNEFGEYDDVFCNAELEQIVARYDASTQDGKNVKNLDAKDKLKRYKVIEVSEGPYQTEVSKFEIQKIVHIKDVTSNGTQKVLLRNSWFDATTVSSGEFVHIVGSFDKRGVCVVDNKHNYIIVNPDFLVSATTVADTVSCMRKAVLQERVRATGDISKAMVYGNILHALFQSALEDNDFSTKNLHLHVDKILVDNIESLYILREDISIAVEYVRSKIILIQDWARTFLSPKPNAKATVSDHRGSGNPIVAINKLLDIEEHVWSPTYGLKGNIDATVQATIVEPKNANGRSSKTVTIPLELKTGRSQSMAHRAQTMLYTLLMSDRYDINVHGGLLYYMETNEMIRVPAIRNELRELIVKRNQVASFMSNRETLPEMLEDEYSCSRCYAKTPCFIYHKLLEGGTAESSGAAEPFLETTAHLNAKHETFFKHWDLLLTKEEKDSVRFRRELWAMSSSDREVTGRCYGHLVIVPGSISVDQSNQKINKYTYSFQKHAPSGFNFMDSQLNEGDPIVVSDEKGHIGLAIGYVFQIRQNFVTVQVDRRLHNARTRQKNFHAANNQVFDGIVESQATTGTQTQVEEITYRIDKDEFSNGMSKIRNNLIQIMSPNSNDKYRHLIVDLEPPIFKESPAAYQLDEPSGQLGLNDDQRRAVYKVISARDYALVLGMPGTGKTTTIAHIIRVLASQGKSVLLTSYTHTAVDNILLKIKNEKFGILRLGTRAKIHHEVQTFAQLADTHYKSFDELRVAFNQPKVVATTCLGINHPIFSERQFDYCIVDEASQITLPVCLGPIRLANVFILVGDHYQLPPLVKNAEAREGGLDISLFKLLSESHPQAVVSLEYQYRMCEEIMTLSNELIYSGRLKCGTLEVAKRALQLPDKDGLQIFHQNNTKCQSRCWLSDLLSENVKAFFINTDSVPAREEKKGDRIINPVEAELTSQIVEGFLSCGVDPNSIGVITVYRSQLKVIQNLLRYREKVEMHTADKFQGRDKEVIVVSLVRSNDQGNIGELLRDWRRINVAFTRARSKLIILGSKSTLRSNDLLGEFVGLMERKSWVYDLPADANLLHRDAWSLDEKNARSGQGLPKRIHGKGALLSGQTFFGNRPVLRNIMNELA